MAPDDLNSGNTPDTIDPRAVMKAFYDSEAEAAKLGEDGITLRKYLTVNPGTGKCTLQPYLPIEDKHRYREALLKITQTHGQTDIVDACLLDDLEGVRTETSSGVVKYPHPHTGIISGEEFAVSSALEVARMVGSPNGRVKKKLDEIPLNRLLSAFWFRLSKNTQPILVFRTTLNLAILAEERKSTEASDAVDWAKRNFVTEALPALPGLSDNLNFFLIIPDDLLEYAVFYLVGNPYIGTREDILDGLYPIVIGGLRDQSSGTAEKLERCPKFKAMINAKTERLQKEYEEKVKEAKQKLDRVERTIETCSTSEEIFVRDVLTHAYSILDIRFICGETKNSLRTLDGLCGELIRTCQISDDTTEQCQRIQNKWLGIKQSRLAEISGFASNPTREIYKKIIEEEYPDSASEETLHRLEDNIKRVRRTEIFPEDALIFQLLGEKRRRIDENIKRLHEETNRKAATEEYREALTAYRKSTQDTERRKQKGLKRHGGLYTEASERRHIKAEIEARSAYLKELYRIGTGTPIDAWTDAETEDENTLAYVEFGAEHSGGGGMEIRLKIAAKVDMAMRCELRPKMSESDRIVTETGKDMKSRRLRLEMVDWTTAHEVGHIIDVINRNGTEKNAEKSSGKVIEKHIAEMEEVLKDISSSQNIIWRKELIELMEECMIDGIAHRLTQDYGTSDFEYDSHNHRLEQTARAFIAACEVAEYNMRAYTDMGIDTEKGIKFCLTLQRLIVCAGAQLENISKLEDKTLEDVRLDLDDKIKELKGLYFGIKNEITIASEGIMIDPEAENKIEALFKVMFNEGLNLEFENALDDSFKRPPDSADIQPL